jgi:EipB-like
LAAKYYLRLPMGILEAALRSFSSLFTVRAALAGAMSLGTLASAGTAGAVDIAPHRALYSMTLGSTKSNSGVVAARGTMVYEWGETCDGWTVEQRYKLNMQYSDSPDVEISSNYVTWESKDGLKYRFNERKLRNGEPDEEVRGDAQLDGPGQGGSAEFVRPTKDHMDLAPGVVFPTAHTLDLITHAAKGEQFLSRLVFDGSAEENAAQITAVIGGEQIAVAKQTGDGPKSPLLDRPSWRMRLAFFPAGTKADQPDYELGMQLLDNGVSREMLLDYGDFAIKAKLDEIEALPRPAC